MRHPPRVDARHRHRRLSRRSVVLALAASILIAGCTRGGGSEGGATAVRSLAEPMPALSGQDLAGEPIATTDYRGRVLVVNAWATWCTPCEQEQPALVRLAHRYAPRGVRFLGIDHMDQDAAASNWVRKYDVPYPSIVDPSGRFAASLDYFGLPDTYVVDPGGMIRFAIGPGATTEQQLSEILEEVLADQTSASIATATNSPAR